MTDAYPTQPDPSISYVIPNTQLPPGVVCYTCPICKQGYLAERTNSGALVAIILVSVICFPCGLFSLLWMDDVRELQCSTCFRRFKRP